MLGCHLHGLETTATCLDPHPIYLLECNNTAGESWLAKGCTSSATGHKLSQLQAALLLDQGAGYHLGHADTKTNIIADGISRILSEHAIPHEFPLLLTQAPSLRGCRCFRPNAALISSIVDVLLQNDCMDHLSVSKQLLIQENSLPCLVPWHRPPRPVHSQAAHPRAKLDYRMLRGVPHPQKHNHRHTDSTFHSLRLRQASALPTH